MVVLTHIAMIGIVLIMGACSATSSTFLLGKGRTGYYYGSNSNAIFDMLCTSGDLDKVLLATNLSMEMKENLYKYNCSAERSGEKVKKLYASMTSKERKDIKNAFRKNGYEINHLLC